MPKCSNPVNILCYDLHFNTMITVNPFNYAALKVCVLRVQNFIAFKICFFFVVLICNNE